MAARWLGAAGGMGELLMPTRAMRICSYPRCFVLSHEARCPAHKRQGWAEHQRGRSSAARGYGSAWRKARAQVLAEERYCSCGCGRPSTDVDHIVPKSRGGSDERANLRGVNALCHRAKTARERIG
jgi:5-methylcytosine-specific restriction protein A